jgi:dipeptidase E
VLELTVLPSLTKDIWLPEVEAADAIIVGQGNGFYLSFWMQKSGLFDILPELLEKGKTYVGISAGSMILTHSLSFNRKRFEKTGVYYDDEYEEEAPINAGSDKTMRLVDFVIRPHLNSNMFPEVTLENIEKWAAKIDVPLYAIDDQTALKVIDGKVEVITEGNWKLFENSSARRRRRNETILMNRGNDWVKLLCALFIFSLFSLGNSFLQDIFYKSLDLF